MVLSASPETHLRGVCDPLWYELFFKKKKKNSNPILLVYLWWVENEANIC